MKIGAKTWALSFLFLLVASGFVSDRCFCVSGDSQGSSRLADAEQAVGQAFNAVLAAEHAGANVTSLLNQLNGAEDLLAQAENVYRTGDDNTAANKADAVLLIAQQVTTAAQTAKETAPTLAQTFFWSTITVIYAIEFVLVLFLVWCQFKRRYINSLSETKPEVTSQ